MAEYDAGTVTVGRKHDDGKIFEQNIKAFDKWAPVYDTSILGKQALKLQDHIFGYLYEIRFESVLDVACGTGVLLERVKGVAETRKQTVRLAGIDLSPGMLEVARKKFGAGADLRRGRADDLPWGDGNFDVVTCTNSFHHFPDPDKVLLEMKRVLKPGGTLIIADVWFPWLLRYLANLLLPFSSEGDVHIYSEKEILDLMRKTGFTNIKWHRIFVYAGITTAKKVAF